jgi:replicative DNA helicase
MATIPEATRIPPYSEEAERGIIGSILLDPKAIRVCIEHELMPDDFYVPAHRLIYEAACEIFEKKHIPDLITVPEKMQMKGTFEQCGGIMTLQRIVDATPTSAHLQYYLNIVQRKAKLRQVIQVCRDTEGEAFETDEGIEAFLSKLKFEFHKIGFNHRPTESVSEIVQRLIASYHGARETGSTGLKSRWFDLQNKVVGFFKQKITIIAGRPGQGKTTFGLNEALSLALTGIPGLIISIEMTKDEIVEKLIGDFAGLNIKQFKLGRCSYEEVQRFKLAGDVIEQLPLYILDGNFTIEQICAAVREHVEEYKIQFCVIDYIQIVSPSQGKKFQNRNAELSFMSQQIVALGNDTGIHFFVVSQLSRGIRPGEEPELHHLRDSGALEQDAYMVIFIFENPDAEGEFLDNAPTIVKVAKNRGGEIGKVFLTFEKTKQRFKGQDNRAFILEDYLHLLREEEEDDEEAPF